jgi:4-oxalocrotonate tautomerase
LQDPDDFKSGQTDTKGYYSSLFIVIINMPIVTVSMFGGRTQIEKDRLAEAITEDVTRILKVQKKEVIVVIEEAPRGNWYSAGVRL